jgi:hypothetical protein
MRYQGPEQRLTAFRVHLRATKAGPRRHCSQGSAIVRNTAKQTSNVGVDLVCVRLEIASRRSRRGGGQLLLFSGEPFALRSRSSLFGLGGLTVGLELADLREIPSVARFATTRCNPGLLAPFRRKRQTGDRNDDDDNDDDYSRHSSPALPMGEKAWVRGSLA